MFTLIPAYGRKYETAVEAILDWLEGKDWQIVNGPYTSIRDLRAFPGDHATILYNGNSCFIVRVPTGEILL